MRRAAVLPDATMSEIDGVRYLHLDSIWVQGAMRVRKPHHVELEYVQRMLAALLWLPTASLGQGRAVQLGLGAGAITRFTHGRLKMDTTAVEINPQVIGACRAWFRLPDDGPRLRVLNMDAGHWIADVAEPASVQLLHVDLYDQEAAAPVLDDEDFYAGCRRVLAEGGVMAVNLFGRDASFERSAARIAATFGADQVWSLRATREGNTVVVAGRAVEVPSREVLRERAAVIEERWGDCGLPARKWPRMVRAHGPLPPYVESTSGPGKPRA
jgi:spermidine synthase